MNLALNHQSVLPLPSSPRIMNSIRFFHALVYFNLAAGALVASGTIGAITARVLELPRSGERIILALLLLVLIACAAFVFIRTARSFIAHPNRTSALRLARDASFVLACLLFGLVKIISLGWLFSSDPALLPLLIAFLIYHLLLKPAAIRTFQVNYDYYSEVLHATSDERTVDRDA